MELKLSIQKRTVLAVDNIKLEDCSTDQRSVSEQLVRGNANDPPMPTPANTFHTPSLSDLASKKSEAATQDDHVKSTTVPTTTRIVTTGSKLELLKTEKTETTTTAPVTVFNLTNSTTGIVQSDLEPNEPNQNSTGDNSTANPIDFYQQTTVADYGFIPDINLHDFLLGEILISCTPGICNLNGSKLVKSTL